MKSKNQIRDLFSINLTKKIGVQGLPCLKHLKYRVCTPSNIIISGELYCG
jgi:hypothetical protein